MGSGLNFSQAKQLTRTTFVWASYFLSWERNKEQPRVWNPAVSVSESLSCLSKCSSFLFSEKLNELQNYVLLSNLSLVWRPESPQFLEFVEQNDLRPPKCLFVCFKASLKLKLIIPLGGQNYIPLIARLFRSI